MKNNYKRSQSSIKETYKREEEKEKKKELEEKGFCPISIKYPKRAKEKSKEHTISSSKIRRPLGDSEEDHQKLKEQKYKVFFKAFQAATNLTTRVCLFSCIYL